MSPKNTTFLHWQMYIMSPQNCGWFGKQYFEHSMHAFIAHFITFTPNKNALLHLGNIHLHDIFFQLHYSMKTSLNIALVNIKIWTKRKFPWMPCKNNRSIFYWGLKASSPKTVSTIVFTYFTYLSLLKCKT